MSHLLSSRAYNRHKRAERSAKGQCLSCGRDPLPGRSLCAACKAIHNRSDCERMARRRAAWRALGICLICGDRLAMPNDTRCGACADQQDEYKACRRHPVEGVA